MIQNLLINIIQIIIGLGGGLAVGAGFVAFLTVLGIIPRLIQLTKTERLLKVYSSVVIAGTLFGTYLTFTNITWDQPIILLVIWGAFQGIFNGMLAAALTEVLNVFPILTRRIGIEKYTLWLLMAIVFGKIAGSLFQWVYFVT
ncbi:stage V sporulation protein AB [Virgibacillus natechei]|uniref:Stage V sporulation protein AB n=1 Tax=Virgibacillus natechei TaxID=1216297 RepID=A0ABS4IFD9_9BACI|nr:stage V sporulation protein AB [Virgibacillus natechei]MBP1969658.1 stage V sporulation protein AB [Virgibacillus natechei]UZD11385.1 stage V sporulation protein AB [Virgibacillus natechei]